MAKKDKKKDKGKAKGKKKEKAKKAKKLPKQSELASKKSKKSDKKATSTKALKQEIRQLREALQAHEQSSPAQPVAAALDSLTGGLDELVRSAATGSVSERKKSWERHQYLRTRYEHHLEAGSAKAQARVAADRDLRERYGDRFGYTREELDSILS